MRHEIVSLGQRFTKFTRMSWWFRIGKSPPPMAIIFAIEVETKIVIKKPEQTRMASGNSPSFSRGNRHRHFCSCSIAMLEPCVPQWPVQPSCHCYIFKCRPYCQSVCKPWSFTSLMVIHRSFGSWKYFLTSTWRSILATGWLQKLFHSSKQTATFTTL